MYNRQTKDNNKWCDLANLINLYNSDNIHHMVDNKSQTLITDTVKYIETKLRHDVNTHIKQAYKKYTF